MQQQYPPQQQPPPPWLLQPGASNPTMNAAMVPPGQPQGPYGNYPPQQPYNIQQDAQGMTRQGPNADPRKWKFTGKAVIGWVALVAIFFYFLGVGTVIWFLKEVAAVFDAVGAI